MTKHGQTRRHILHGFAAATAGATASAAFPSTATAAAHITPQFGPVVIGPDDQRYLHLVARGNRRFTGRPQRVHVVGSTEQVVRAVQEAVKAGKRIAVRSGGHCFEGFVDDPAVQSLIDMSGMTGVYFDPQRRAFAVEAGATLGEAYRRLYLGWGVTIPAGYCPTVGAGGHVAGGGYGPLCRLHGLVVDHLYAIEIVVVDRAGVARSVVATREPGDPNRELWWAHTGGGGGNFGVVTRYWFRTPGARGTDPGELLPRPPGEVLTFDVAWPWEALDENNFSRLVRNYGSWCERTAAPGRAEAAVYSEFLLFRRNYGTVRLTGQVAGAAAHLLDEQLAAIGDGVPVAHTRSQQRMPWLAAALKGSGEDGKDWRLKTKAAYLRRGLADRQIAAAYRHLTRDDYDNPGGSLSLNSYGGQVNTVPAHATAAAQRDSVMKLFYLVAWADPAQDARHVAWLREFYRDMFADTGGVPVPGDITDGSFINYPDVDLADPVWNTSGVPWPALYYKDNYTRLQRVKARWDPRDVFRHELAIRAD